MELGRDGLRGNFVREGGTLGCAYRRMDSGCGWENGVRVGVIIWMDRV